MGLAVERDRALQLELSQAVKELQSQDTALSGDTHDLASNSKKELSMAVVELQSQAEQGFHAVGAKQERLQCGIEEQVGKLTHMLQKQDAEVRLLERSLVEERTLAEERVQALRDDMRDLASEKELASL